MPTLDAYVAKVARELTQPGKHDGGEQCARTLYDAEHAPLPPLPPPLRNWSKASRLCCTLHEGGRSWSGPKMQIHFRHPRQSVSQSDHRKCREKGLNLTILPSSLSAEWCGRQGGLREAFLAALWHNNQSRYVEKVIHPLYLL